MMGTFTFFAFFSLHNKLARFWWKVGKKSCHKAPRLLGYYSICCSPLFSRPSNLVINRVFEWAVLGQHFIWYGKNWKGRQEENSSGQHTCIFSTFQAFFLCVLAETHFHQNGETHFQNRETHFRNQETHFREPKNSLFACFSSCFVLFIP